MIQVGDVLVAFTSLTNPPKAKLHLCVAVSEGYFFRINTHGHFSVSKPLLKKNNSFLKHDSYIECGSLLEFDETMIEDAIAERPGIIGSISLADLENLHDFSDENKTLTSGQRKVLKASLLQAIDKRK